MLRDQKGVGREAWKAQCVRDWLLQLRDLAARRQKRDVSESIGVHEVDLTRQPGPCEARDLETSWSVFSSNLVRQCEEQVESSRIVTIARFMWRRRYAYTLLDLS